MPEQNHTPALSYAIVFVSDMRRSVDFYRDKVGLTLRFESPAWTEFETGQGTLALHAVPPGAPHGSDRTLEEIPGSCRPGLRVPDLDAFHRRMQEHGVKCVKPPATTFGARLAQYADPDGLTISVGETRRTSSAR